MRSMSQNENLYDDDGKPQNPKLLLPKTAYENCCLCVCEWIHTHNEIASALVPPIKVSELTCCIFKQFNLFVISFCDSSTE